MRSTYMLKCQTRGLVDVAEVLWLCCGKLRALPRLGVVCEGDRGTQFFNFIIGRAHCQFKGMTISIHF